MKEHKHETSSEISEEHAQEKVTVTEKVTVEKDVEGNVEEVSVEKTVEVEEGTTPEHELTVRTEGTLSGPWELLRGYALNWKARWQIFTRFNFLVAVAFLVSFLAIGGSVIALFALADAPLQGSERMLQNWIAGQGIVIVGLVVAAIVFFAAMVILSAMMTIGNLLLWKDGDMPLKELIKKSWELTPGYIWISILAFITVALGLFFFIIPGILLAISFSLAMVVLIATEKRGKEALLESRRLVRGFIWPLVGRGILLGLMLIVPTIIISILFGGILRTPDLADFINNLYSLFVVTPVASGILYHLYQELKVRKEGEEKKEDGIVRASIIGGGVMLGIILLLLVVASIA